MSTFEKDAVREETLPLMTLVDAANIAQRGLEKRLGGLKLSVAQQRILSLVYFAKESLTPSMLAALLLQETHSVSGLLNRLEDRDLITRTRDRQDRRVGWVGLTPAGRQGAEEAIEIVMGVSEGRAPGGAAPRLDLALAFDRTADGPLGRSLSPPSSLGGEDAIHRVHL